MKNIQKNAFTIGAQAYNLVEKTNDNHFIYGMQLIPTVLPEGVSIVDGSGRVIPSDQANTWNKDMGLTGIGANSSGHSFIFGIADNVDNSHQDDGSINTPKEWSVHLYGTYVGNGITSTINRNTAESDFRSKENTDAIITDMDSTVETDNAARVCRNYSAGVIGVGQWDLPALGVLKIINDLRTSIISLMTTIGKSYWNSLLDSYWAWSSTEYSSRSSWRFGFGYQTSNDSYKNNYDFVVPVFTIS